MYILFYIIAGLILIYWLFGMSRDRLRKPRIFTMPIGMIGILIAAAFFALLGYLFSR